MSRSAPSDGATLLLFLYLRSFVVCAHGTCLGTFDSVFKWQWPACDSRYLESNVVVEGIKSR